jgi:predicted PurR-regulated permease PerM
MLNPSPTEPQRADAEPTDIEAADPAVLILPTAALEEELRPGPAIGTQGRPFDRRSPFLIGLTGALGVAVAYGLVKGLVGVATVLVLLSFALFVAIGLNPVLEWLTDHHCSRYSAVAIVLAAFVAVLVGFVFAAIYPITHEVRHFIAEYPKLRAQALSGKGWLGRLSTELHLDGYLRGKKKPKLPMAGGVLGVGKTALSVVVGAISVCALTIYFLIALPGVKRFFLSTIPRSRRERVGLLTDEVFERVGGFMLGNLITSVISGLGTYIWLLVFGVPYPLLLAMFVALFDLIPLVGSTIAGLVVSLVALDRGLAIAIATACFYIAYRFLEDYLLNPRVMRHTVRISPGLTVIATLIGGALLGIFGALIAIPTAATIHLLYEEVLAPRQNAH